MKVATLLILLLSHDGYWFADRPSELRFESAAQAPAGRVTWDLMYGAVRVGGGAVDVGGGQAVTVRLTAPPVRSRIELRLVYRFADAAGKQLESGEAVVHVFPDNLLENASRALDGKRLAVRTPADDPFVALLTRAAIPHVFATDTQLRLGHADVIWFGPGTIDAAGATARPPLEDLARRGATVIVMRQQTSDRVLEYRLARRKIPAKFAWRGDHPLLGAFTPDDLASLAAPGSEQVAVRLPTDEPALELSWWPAEVPTAEHGPIDALLLTRTVGHGRIVLCQLPFAADWAEDPRGQLFLRAFLEYAATPPGPTPRPSERVPVVEVKASDRKHNASDPLRVRERNVLTPNGTERP